MPASSESISAAPKLVMVNGEFSDQIRVDDRGLAFADGLFESMRYVAGTIPLLDRHIQRLLAGCLSLQICIDEYTLRDQLSLFLSRAKPLAIPLGKIKLTVTRGSGGRGCYPDHVVEGACQSHSLILQLSTLAEDTATHRVRLVSASSPLIFPQALVGIKHLSRLPYILAALNTNLQGDDEILFYDDKGMVAETMHHNVFFISENTLFTPKLNQVGVAGIARALILDSLASCLGLTFAQDDIHLQDIARFDACFIANSVRGVCEVSAIDDVAFAKNPLFPKIDAAFRKILDGEG